jgi:membrane-bound lytic murein transglycosylase A
MAEDAASANAAADLVPLRFDDLAGWLADDHASAFATFRRSAEHIIAEPPSSGALGISAADLQDVARRALDLAVQPSSTVARQFFEQNFRPFAVRPHAEAAFLTGYFEPEVCGSLQPTDIYRYPLYCRPPDLVDVTDRNRPPGWDASYIFARRTDGGLVRYFDRADIDAGILVGRNLELVYLADPIDAFFIHVQGSASIRLEGGNRMRVAYAAKSGHPYTSIGRRLIERGVATPETMTLAHLRAWLTENRAEGAALMRENRSYIFFHELSAIGLDPDLGAIAAAGVQITPERSLAVDHRQHTYGTPIWVDALLPTRADGSSERVQRLMLAQDTGSAIVGAARGDMFMGLGQAAGERAGRIRHVPDAFVVLKPIRD